MPAGGVWMGKNGWDCPSDTGDSAAGPVSHPVTRRRPFRWSPGNNWAITCRTPDHIGRILPCAYLNHIQSARLSLSASPAYKDFTWLAIERWSLTGPSIAFPRINPQITLIEFLKQKIHSHKIHNFNAWTPVIYNMIRLHYYNKILT